MRCRRNYIMAGKIRSSVNSVKFINDRTEMSVEATSKEMEGGYLRLCQIGSAR